jgi:DNA-directed RNA polymerase specialized sigma24 family protein
MGDATPQSPRYQALGELLHRACADDDLPAFMEVIEALSPTLFRRADGFVRPGRAPALVAETWIRAWCNRGDYRLSAAAVQPLDWLHRQMCLAARTMSSTRSLDRQPDAPVAGDIGRIEAAVMADKLASVRSVEDVEADLLADVVDDLIDSLDGTDGVLLRRRCALGEDWPRIAADIDCPGPHVATWRYRRALARFVQRRNGQLRTSAASRI